MKADREREQVRLGEIEVEMEEEEKVGAQSCPQVFQPTLLHSHSWPQAACEWGPVRKTQTKQMQ